MTTADRELAATEVLVAGRTLAEAMYVSGLDRAHVEQLADHLPSGCKHVRCGARTVSHSLCRKHYDWLRHAPARFAKRIGAL